MLNLIEKVIRDCGALHVVEATFGADILVGIDFPCYCGLNNATDNADATIVYEGTEIKDSIEDMCSKDDLFAIDAENFLSDYAKKEAAFLFARGKTLEEAFEELGLRLNEWYLLSVEERRKLLLSFVELRQEFVKKHII